MHHMLPKIPRLLLKEDQMGLALLKNTIYWEYIFRMQKQKYALTTCHNARTGLLWPKLLPSSPKLKSLLSVICGIYPY